MKKFLVKFKIPTILGLSIIFLGIITGVFLTLTEQIFTSKASISINPVNITLTNLSDDSVTISWETQSLTTSFITFGQTDPSEQTVLDDRDSKTPPNVYSMHYVTIKNLLPKTSYEYKILSGKISTEAKNFTTAAPLATQTGFRPIIGSILDGNKPLDEGIVYLSIADAAVESSLVKNSGNFLIPISQLRKADLSDSFTLADDTLVKLTIVSAKGQTTVLFKLKDSDKGLPPIKLGEDLDLTNIIPSPSPSASNSGFDKYDLNGDGKVNAADNAIILQNFGKNPKNKKADINGDGVVDQKDLDLMSQKIKTSGSQ